jgi:hypothetical protein
MRSRRGPGRGRALPSERSGVIADDPVMVFRIATIVGIGPILDLTTRWHRDQPQ